MKISVESGRVEDKRTDIFVLSLFEGHQSPLTKRMDELLDGQITKVIESGDFKGKLSQTITLYTQGKVKADRLLLIGLGEEKEFSLETVRGISGEAAKKVRDSALPRYMTTVHGEDVKIPISSLVQALVEGSELALYTFNRFKTETKDLPKQVEEMTVFVSDGNLLPEVERTVHTAQTICDATKLARDIANTPSGDMTPTTFADISKKVAETYSLNCIILEKSDMARMGMGGLLSVSSGSEQPPKMVVLEYVGRKEAPLIVLVGKGITFDSGGISIKPSEKMDEMKYDKSGAAAVIAVMQAVSSLKLPLKVVAATPLTENLPSGSAYKPGDVVKHYGGKTSEVISTDAEGRLILADALAYVAERKPDVIIDLATLTGACVIALGSQASGMFTNNQALGRRVIEAGKFTGERVWELPLWKEYFDQIKSEVADIKNSGGRSAGAITGAIFLQQFIGETPWVHLDIAGTAYTQEDGTKAKSYQPKGATGTGVRLLIQILRQWAEPSDSGKRGKASINL